jgi:hypothetical protein
MDYQEFASRPENALIDDSLLLGWKKGTSSPIPATEQHLSVSTIKQFSEDPQKYYLRKVLKKKEPPSLPLAFGSAFHEGLEAFYAPGPNRIDDAVDDFKAALTEWWPKLEQAGDVTDRFNQRQPARAGRKKNHPTSLDAQLEKGERLIRGICGVLDRGYDVSTPTRHMDQSGEIENALGELAADRGLPTDEMKIYDYNAGYMRDLPVAVIGGVPVHGFVDLVLTVPGWGEMIIDHKTVTHIVSYYSDTSYFPPSYNARDDLQLDVYSVATGITRAGFQFITKQPQYVPRSGQLWPEWVREEQWHRMDRPTGYLPMAPMYDPNQDLRYCMVWRPDPDDHPAMDDTYRPMRRWGQTAYKLRRAAEKLTESLILYRDGVEPRIAFPAGDPSEIAKKACPFCHFNDNGLCAEPRDGARAAAEYKAALEERQDLIASNDDIQERRERWTQTHNALFS